MLFAPNDESKTKALIKNAVINWTDLLCKIRINVINCGVMLEVGGSRKSSEWPQRRQ